VSCFEEYEFKVFEDIFGTKKNEVAKEFRIICKEEFPDYTVI
jgi:hypothetical protein